MRIRSGVSLDSLVLDCRALLLLVILSLLFKYCDSKLHVIYSESSKIFSQQMNINYLFTVHQHKKEMFSNSNPILTPSQNYTDKYHLSTTQGLKAIDRERRNSTLLFLLRQLQSNLAFHLGSRTQLVRL